MKKRASFLDLLEELRWRILTSLMTIGIFSIVAWFFTKPLLDFLTQPLVRLAGSELYFNAPYEAFLVHLKVALLTGLLAGSPVFFAQLWLFVAPGLHRRERQIIFPLTLISVFLFLLGAAFAFWIVVPASLQFLLNFQTESMKPLLGIGPYFSLLIGMILAGGILFDLPVVVLGLVRAGVLGAEGLRRTQKEVIVGIFILAAILTPSPDPLGQLLLALPLVLLYEVSLRIAKWVEKK